MGDLVGLGGGDGEELSIESIRERVGMSAVAMMSCGGSVMRDWYARNVWYVDGLVESVIGREGKGREGKGRQWIFIRSLETLQGSQDHTWDGRRCA